MKGLTKRQKVSLIVGIVLLTVLGIVIPSMGLALLMMAGMGLVLFPTLDWLAKR